MELHESLKVMLVDGRAARSTELTSGLEAAGCRIVRHIRPTADLERAVNECAPDVIIVDLEAPDDSALDGMRSLGGAQPRPIVMFVDDSDRESIREAVEAGVSAYVVKGSAAERVRPVLEVAIERFRKQKELEEELRQARNSLAERKLIERAKGLLMEKQGIRESEAFAAMRKMAMTRNLKLSEVAQRIIDMADLLT